MEVADNQVKVLVDVVERIEEIDIERAEKAELRAEKRLAEPNSVQIDLARALASLERAKARKKLATLIK
jgi:F-type H+-transporting ATPase subunit epsilon